MYSLVKVNGAFVYLTGRTKDQLMLANAIELKLPYEWLKYIKRVLSFANGTDNNTASCEKNMELYELLTKKHRETIYTKRPNSLGERLADWESNFIKLPIEKQIYILKQILQISAGGNQGADLQLIGGSAKTGTCKISKNITKNAQFELISMSPTGIYSKKINLKTI